MPFCKICKKVVPKVSRKGYCRDCSVFKQELTWAQLQRRSGPIYEKWQKNLQAGLERSHKRAQSNKTKGGDRS